MSVKRLLSYTLCLALALMAGTAQAGHRTYSLAAGSGAHQHIGNGLPLPIQPVAIAPAGPDILYVGTGEQNNRQSSSWGNGVYRSNDGGETWRHLGLVETRHIGRVLVHPRDPDIAYVAALGNLGR